MLKKTKKKVTIFYIKSAHNARKNKSLNQTRVLKCSENNREHNRLLQVSKTIENTKNRKEIENLEKFLFFPLSKTP